MPPSNLVLPFAWRERLAALSPEWRLVLPRLALAWAAILVLFGADWSAMAGQWWNSSTYNHILLIPIILFWLVQQRAAELARIVPEGWWPGLLIAGAAAFLWVLGVFAGVATARQLGVVCFGIGTTLALVGPRVGAGVAFPLSYMLLLVPFGDELVPALQMITAEITIGLVHLSGIAAVIDGVFIHTPAGLFEVAEACSGVKFLIAMVAFGILVANTCFASWARRTIFLVACFIVPILANGVRAWATVFAAQYVGAEAATGFDHIIYGWFFFGLVLALILGAAWRFFDRSVDEPAIDPARIAASPFLARLAVMRIRSIAALAGLAAIAIVAIGWTRAAETLSARLPAQIFLPEVAGWRQVDYRPSVWWEPRATGANRRLLGRFVDAQGHEVDVFLALYAAQKDGSEAGGFGEGALTPGRGWAWQSDASAVDGAKGERLLAEGRVERIAQTSYRTGDILTGSNARLKLANMEDRLLLRARPTMLLIVSAEDRPGRPASAAIDAFRSSAGPIDQWMDRIAGLR
jgi:exosortase A